MKKPRLLNIGSGVKEFTPKSITDAFTVVRLDIDEDVKPDVVATATEIPFEDESFEAVYASHILEHIDLRVQPNILHEWYRVLKPGGQMYILVPNLSLVAEKVLENDHERGLYPIGDKAYMVTPMDMLFGLPADTMKHQWGFTRETLAERVDFFNWNRGLVWEVRCLGTYDRAELRFIGEKKGKKTFDGFPFPKKEDVGDPFAIEIGDNHG